MRLFSPATRIACFWIVSSSFALAAEPLIIEDARLIPSDNSPAGFGRAADIDGNVAVVGATEGSNKVENARPGAAYVFERQSNGTWQQVAKLLPLVEDGDTNFGIAVAVEGDTIVVGSHYSGETAIFERHNGVWARAATLADAGGYQVDIHSGTVMTSTLRGADLFRRGASGWTRVQTLQNGLPLPDADYPGPDIAISATTAIHGSYGADENDYTHGQPPVAYIYPLGANHTWQGAPVAELTRPGGSTMADGFAGLVAISDSIAVISGGINPNYIFERNAQGVWNSTQTIDNAYAVDGNTILSWESGVRVYRRNSSGVWTRQASLVPSTGEQFSARPKISGNRVIAGQFVYTLPATFSPNPPTVQEDLEDGVANGWVAQPNSTFTVANANGTRVYRQTNTVSGATSVYNNADWGRQSIQAEITPRAYAPSIGDRWFGLMVRYIDANNYYYITARNSNTLDLKRMQNGTYQTLASVPLQVTLNRTYPLRLEAQGQRLRAFVNGRLVIDVLDSALTHGRPGVTMYRTQADFDNLILNPDPSLVIKDEHFNTPTIVMDWDYADYAYRWVKLPERNVFTQPTTGGGAHALAGPTFGYEDQSIRARMRATQFVGADRWFGLIGRYVDASNYYYVTVRSSNNISLRKLTNGVITVLDTATMPVAANTWYSLRLDILGNKLRAYVDEQLILEATDGNSPHQTGRYGLGSYKTAAEADDVLAVRP